MEAAGEEQVEAEPALVIKVTCPEGSDMAISFNKNSGRPVKVAGKVFALDDRELMQETIFAAYKNFGGIHVATRLKSRSTASPTEGRSSPSSRSSTRWSPRHSPLRRTPAAHSEPLPFPCKDSGELAYQVTWRTIYRPTREGWAWQRPTMPKLRRRAAVERSTGTLPRLSAQAGNGERGLWAGCSNSGTPNRPGRDEGL